MKLKINIDKKDDNKIPKFTDEDLPLVTVFRDLNCMIIKDNINFDEVKYYFVDLKDGATIGDTYTSLEGLLNNLEDGEKIVEAELNIR